MKEDVLTLAHELMGFPRRGEHKPGGDYALAEDNRVATLYSHVAQLLTIYAPPIPPIVFRPYDAWYDASSVLEEMRRRGWRFHAQEFAPAERTGPVVTFSRQIEVMGEDKKPHTRWLAGTSDAECKTFPEAICDAALKALESQQARDRADAPRRLDVLKT